MIGTWDRERFADEAYDARHDDVELEHRCPDCCARWPAVDEDEASCPRCGCEETCSP